MVVTVPFFWVSTTEMEPSGRLVVSVAAPVAAFVTVEVRLPSGLVLTDAPEEGPPAELPPPEEEPPPEDPLDPPPEWLAAVVVTVCVRMSLRPTGLTAYIRTV